MEHISLKKICSAAIPGIGLPLLSIGGSASAPDAAVWAPVNLLLAAATLCASFILLASIVQADTSSPVTLLHAMRGRCFLALLSHIPALLALIIFLHTQDPRLSPVPADPWTPVLLFFALVQAVLCFLSLKKRRPHPAALLPGDI